MKKLLLLSLATGLVVGLNAQTKERELVFNNQQIQLQLAFEDEFNGNAMNTDVWQVRTGVTRDAKQEVTRQWLLPGMVSVNNGNCVIRTVPMKRENQEFSVWITDGMKPFKGNFSYDTGEFESTQAFHWGYYEIKCKLPKGKEAWPAFWLYGEADGTNNEIDVFEFWNESNAFGKLNEKKLSRVQHATVHYHGAMDGEGYDLKFDGSLDFHTYGVLWMPTYIVWYTDGEPIRVLYRYTKRRDRKKGDVAEGRNENVFPRAPMHILVDMAMQQTTNEATPLEVPDFVIDYVKYYKIADNVEK
jgi:beta-glucanase (GH16 family)